MLVAVLSDVHANLAALEAALRLVDQRRPDALYCLGDTVGYGPDPGPCLDLLRRHADGSVLGNHDEAVASGRGDAAEGALPPAARRAARLHRSLLSEDQLDWLRTRPLRIDAHGATFVHASPDGPGRWHRLDSFAAVRAQFGAFDGPICFVGHAHRPAVASAPVGAFAVRPGHRFLVGVGSVGQPRDGDARLAFALFDVGAFRCEVVRAYYDVEATARRIHARGLPAALADRLRRGA